MSMESRQKIFLIEDDPTMIKLLELLLNLENFVTAKNDQEDPVSIVKQLREFRPDLILMDIYLKQLNGMDFLKELRTIDDLCAIKIIVTSGSDMKDYCLNNGADGFILKPYMPDDLIKMIHMLINQ